jgi:hypothetical protein
MVVVLVESIARKSKSRTGPSALRSASFHGRNEIEIAGFGSSPLAKVIGERLKVSQRENPGGRIYP